MFFPYGDDNFLKNIPLVNILLITVNIFIFAVLASQPGYEKVISQYGYTPATPYLTTIFTSMFLHVNVFHLLGNMWFLWLFGDNLEDKLGKLVFLIFYLLGGGVALLIHSFAAGEAVKNVPCIGASGAISAVMGGYIMLFPAAKIRCFIFIWFKPILFKMSAFMFLGIWFIGQLISSSSVSPGSTGVAYWAHIGGFLFGAGCLFILKEYVFPEMLLSEQKKAVKKNDRKFEAVINAAAQEKRERSKGLECYKESIEECLKTKDITLALKKYAEFEEESIPGALSEHSQKLVAEELLKRNEKLLALQAYLRFLDNYKNSQEIPTVQCRLGLLYGKGLNDIAESIKYLRKGLKHPQAITDLPLRVEAKKAVDRIERLLKKTFVDTRKIRDTKAKFAIIVQLVDKSLLDEEKIHKELMSIGVIGGDGIATGANLGMKLSYNAKENLKTKDGVILQNLNAFEAKLAANKLQSVGIPVLIIEEERLLQFSPVIHNVIGVAIKSNKLLVKVAYEKNIEIPYSKVLYMTLGQLFRFVYPREHPSLLDVTKLENEKSEHTTESDLMGNRLIDIFTVDRQRYRISSLNFKSIDNYTKLFAGFIEDMAAKLGAEKIDERVEMFISTNTGFTLGFKDNKEFTEKGLWALRLKYIYGHLIR